MDYKAWFHLQTKGKHSDVYSHYIRLSNEHKEHIGDASFIVTDGINKYIRVQRPEYTLPGPMIAILEQQRLAQQARMDWQAMQQTENMLNSALLAKSMGHNIFLASLPILEETTEKPTVKKATTRSRAKKAASNSEEKPKRTRKPKADKPETKPKQSRKKTTRSKVVTDDD